MKNNEYSKYIDHTLLSADASKDEITNLCHEAAANKFKSVCINPSYIELSKEVLKDSDVLICTVVGFPLGQMTTEAKSFETSQAVKLGANEIDMVINISKLKSHDAQYCINEINEVVKAANNKTVKVIVETCLLTEQEKILAFQIVDKSNANFIKTSTGFSTSGAKIEDIKLWNEIRNQTKSKLLIKAAGGLKTSEDLANFIKSGADRIGTSKGVDLISGNCSSKKY
ncbi:MAG: deoxyribose-phosphate aldolase [Mycoplasma sp.]